MNRRGRPLGMTEEAVDKAEQAHRYRAVGYTWQQVGEKLNMTRQGASQLAKRHAKSLKTKRK